MSSAVLAIALDWIRLDADLRSLKREEAEKRAELVLAAFPGGLAEGTNTAEISGGYVVKAVARSTPKLDADLVRAALGKLAALGEAGALLAGRLIKWKPDLSLSEWKKLDPKHRKLFAASIVFGELGFPTIEVREPTA